MKQLTKLQKCILVDFCTGAAIFALLVARDVLTTSIMNAPPQPPIKSKKIPIIQK